MEKIYWHKNINLFGNGKFKVRSSDGVIYHFVGSTFNGWIFGADKVTEEGYERGLWESIYEFDLIAKKIDDLTDEEKSELRKTMYDGIWTPDTLLYALDKGVYTGPKSDFDNGIVIDTKTINQNKI